MPLACSPILKIYPFLSSDNANVTGLIFCLRKLANFCCMRLEGGHCIWKSIHTATSVRVYGASMTLEEILLRCYSDLTTPKHPLRPYQNIEHSLFCAGSINLCFYSALFVTQSSSLTFPMHCCVDAYKSLRTPRFLGTIVTGIYYIDLFPLVIICKPLKYP